MPANRRIETTLTPWEDIASLYTNPGLEGSHSGKGRREVGDTSQGIPGGHAIHCVTLCQSPSSISLKTCMEHTKSISLRGAEAIANSDVLYVGTTL